MERLRVYRSVPGPPTAPRGVVFATDDRARSRFVLVDRRTAFEMQDRLRATGRPVEWFTHEHVGHVT